MERYRPLLVAVLFSAALLAMSWRLGWIGEPAVPAYIPAYFDRIQAGMTVAELRDLGGLPHDPDSPEGPPRFEFAGDIDQKRGGGAVVYGDPFIAETRFERGALAYFELRTSDNYPGALVDHADLLALVPVLAEAKALRQPYEAQALTDALGAGARVARIVDREHGGIDVLRWDVEVDGRRVARLEASVAGGRVVAHQLSP